MESIYTGSHHKGDINTDGHYKIHANLHYSTH